MQTFGIANFSFAVSVKQDIETLKKVCWDLMSGEKFKTFCLRTQRSNKQFKFTSQQVNEEVGEYIYEKLNRKKSVSLKNPDCECFIHIINKLALVSMRKIQGPGGMPIGTGSKAMVMMSGGFDSPIAAWFLLRRGVTTSFAHFHSIPYTSQASVEKVHNLIRVLKKFGSSGIMYSIPFADVQKEIMTKTPAPLRVILYRRFMVRIAEALTKKEKCLALVTGDSVGQVASQTLENIWAVNEAATLPVFRPLIGTDKEEIMQIAKQQSICEWAQVQPQRPLDGSKVVAMLLPHRLAIPYLQIGGYGFILIFLLLCTRLVDHLLEGVLVGYMRLVGLAG